MQNLESGLYNLRVQMKTMISLWLIKIIKTACLKSMWLSNIIKTVISWWILQKNKFIMSIKNHQSSRINKITNILKRTLLLSRHQHIHSWGYSGLLIYWTSLIISVHVFKNNLQLSPSCLWTSQFICNSTQQRKVCPHPTYSKLGRKKVAVTEKI